MLTNPSQLSSNYFSVPCPHSFQFLYHQCVGKCLNWLSGEGEALICRFLIVIMLLPVSFLTSSYQITELGLDAHNQVILSKCQYVPTCHCHYSHIPLLTYLFSKEEYLVFLFSKLSNFFGYNVSGSRKKRYICQVRIYKTILTLKT